MTLDRRQFLAGTAGLLAAVPGAAAGSEQGPRDALARAAGHSGRDAARETGRVVDSAVGTFVSDDRTLNIEALKAAFPRSLRETYLNSAGQHPVSLRSFAAAQRYMDFWLHGAGEGRVDLTEPELDELKASYARLISAKPTEVAFIPNTLSGENVVVAGLGLHDGRGNVVTDELHYHGGLYIYKTLQRLGLDVRIVKQRDWRIPTADMDAAIDRNTRLVAITLVSNINGFLHDARAISAMAHARGALLYADVIQAVGTMPFDPRALGIDCCAAGAYKWLMGMKGLGFLYVREEIQDRLRPMQYGERQYTNIQYHNFPGSPPGSGDMSWQPLPGAARYEVGSLSMAAAACQREALSLIHEIGVERIQAHARPLVDRINRELPRLGYPSMTPPRMDTSMAGFLVKDPATTLAKLTRANVTVKIKWGQMRVSPSIFNDQRDVDRLLEALS